MIKYGFFDSKLVDGAYDRTYSASDFSSYFFDKIIGNGVFCNPSSSLQVIASTGMKVILKSGRAWINGRWLDNDSDEIIKLDSSDVSLNRIDRIVLRYDAINRTFLPFLKKGVSATEPLIPSLERTNDIFELSLATIYISKQTTQILQSSITDTRFNKDECGIVTSLIEQVDTTTLYEQYQVALNNFINNKQLEYNEWFENIKKQMNKLTVLKEININYTSYVNQTVFSIPDSADYITDIDILDVYVNGFRVLKGREFINDSKNVIFSAGLQNGDDVLIVIYKNWNGVTA